MLNQNDVRWELQRLKWANELYQQELSKYSKVIHSIHQVIHITPGNTDAIEMVLEAAGV